MSSRIHTHTDIYSCGTNSFGQFVRTYTHNSYVRIHTRTDIYSCGTNSFGQLGRATDLLFDATPCRVDMYVQHTATHCSTLQHTAAHCTTLHHTALYCTKLQHTASHCNALQHTATHCNTLQHTAAHFNTLQHTAKYCNTLQHTATHRNTLQHTTTHSVTPPTLLLATHYNTSQNTLPHTAAHCNTLQHVQYTATHYNTCSTLQHTATHYAIAPPSPVGGGYKWKEHMLQCVAVCCGVWQCVLRCVIVCCQQECGGVLQSVPYKWKVHCNTLQHVQYTATHCNTLCNSPPLSCWRRLQKEGISISRVSFYEKL